MKSLTAQLRSCSRFDCLSMYSSTARHSVMKAMMSEPIASVPVW